MVNKKFENEVVSFSVHCLMKWYVHSSSHNCVGNNIVDQVCKWLETGLWISLGTPISATKVVTEIFLKVVLNT
jgi:hypothetical protein